MNEVLQKIIEMAPLYQSFLQDELSIAISDTEKYLYVLDTDTLKFPVKVGSSIYDAGGKQIVENINKTKQPLVNYVPREITGSVSVQ